MDFLSHIYANIRKRFLNRFCKHIKLQKKNHRFILPKVRPADFIFRNFASFTGLDTRTRRLQMDSYKAHGIVLHTIKYGDTSVVAYILTDTYGRRNYLVQGVKSGKGKGNKAALLQPMFLLEFEGIPSHRSQMDRMKDVRLSHPSSISRSTSAKAPFRSSWPKSFTDSSRRSNPTLRCSVSSAPRSWRSTRWKRESQTSTCGSSSS